MMLKISLAVILLVPSISGAASAQFGVGLPNVARNVIAHELGPAIGLGQSSDKTSLMCGRPSPCRKAVKYLRGFIEEVKVSGLVARTLERAGVRGVSIPRSDAEASN